jgi:hypothetical protein
MNEKRRVVGNSKDALDEPVNVANAGVGFNKFNGSVFDGAEVFGKMSDTFSRVKARFPKEARELRYRIGGQNVSLGVVGSELAKNISQVFTHLQTDDGRTGDTGLSIDLWDENVTGIRSYSDANRPGPGKPDVTSISPDGRFVGQLQPITLSCLDRENQRIVGSMAWSQDVFIYERAKPLSRLILEWSNDQGIQVIHAGLVSKHGKGVLFVARSGSGKSTASLACLCSGFSFAGDDFVGLQRLRDGSFIGHSLYNSVFLETEHLARFPELEPFAIPGGSHEEKAAVILSQVFPERLRTHISIQAVVLPRVADGQESLFGGIPKSQALLAMAPSSLIEIPSRGMEGFERLAQLVEQVPTFEMRLGRDLKTIPECVDKLITSLPHF